jgi:hypothetical protein
MQEKVFVGYLIEEERCINGKISCFFIAGSFGIRRLQPLSDRRASNWKPG